MIHLFTILCFSTRVNYQNLHTKTLFALASKSGKVLISGGNGRFDVVFHSGLAAEPLANMHACPIYVYMQASAYVRAFFHCSVFFFREGHLQNFLESQLNSHLLVNN